MQQCRFPAAYVILHCVKVCGWEVFYLMILSDTTMVSVVVDLNMCMRDWEASLPYRSDKARGATSPLLQFSFMLKTTCHWGEFQYICRNSAWIWRNKPSAAQKIKLKLEGESDIWQHVITLSINISYIDMFYLKTESTMGLYKVVMYLTGMTGSISELCIEA